jgi:bacillithiol system protein YtxJ
MDGRRRATWHPAAMLPALAAQADVEALLAQPGPVWLFKHSNACPISFAAHDAVAAWCAAHPDARGGMVVIQEQRPLSNWIATRLGRIHQSPQLFLLRDGQVAWMATHWGITAEAMERAIS